MDRQVRDPAEDGGEYKELKALGGVLVVSEGAGCALRLAGWIHGQHVDVPWNPVVLGLRVANHQLVWDGTTWAAAGGEAATALVLLVLTAMARRKFQESGPVRVRGGGKRRRQREDIDARARWMGRGKRIEALFAKAVQRKADQLGVVFPAAGAAGELPPGVSIGRSVLEGAELFGSFEDLHLDIWGPRQGKTTSRVVPAIMSAPGSVITTSNKRDVVDTTIKHRAELGSVWVFDPQAIAGDGPPDWSWDPLSFVIPQELRRPLPKPRVDVQPALMLVDHTGGQREQAWTVPGATVRAEQLAAHFADSDDGEEARKDGFFDPEGEDLLAGLLLAAAVADRPISTVWRWVTDSTNPEPARILDVAGYEQASQGLFGQYNYPDKQRSGVFATSKKMARTLKNPELLRWIEPARDRRAFDPRVFTSEDRATLYLLSREGAGSAGPILNALNEAVVEAATDRANRFGGRLPTPLLAVLDEAANVVRWRNLPKFYSHFGSRGIVVMTILQSWPQGVRCWGRDGMKTLWSSANIRVVGSGVGDVEFLRELTDVVGPHQELSGSVTRSTGTGQSSKSVSRNRIDVQTLTISDLAAMPQGRMVVFATGFPAILAETIPWWERPYSDLVQASLTERKPKPPSPTLRVLRIDDDTDEEGVA